MGSEELADPNCDSLLVHLLCCSHCSHVPILWRYSGSVLHAVPPAHIVCPQQPVLVKLLCHFRVNKMSAVCVSICENVLVLSHTLAAASKHSFAIILAHAW